MITSKKDYKDYIKEDLRKNHHHKGLRGLLGNDIVKFLKSLRYLEYVTNTKNKKYHIFVKIYALYWFNKLSKKLGYSIPPNVCGPGLSLPHYGNIVINPKCKIGKNCRIHIGVNIGGGHDGSGKVPIIGNDCYIAPGAKLFGGIKLGNNIQVGANAVVNKSFLEDGHVLVGIPAKSIRIIN